MNRKDESVRAVLPVEARAAMAGSHARARRTGWKHAASVLTGLMLGLAGSASAVDIAQQPLYAGSKVPGNVVLVPSVEYPTIDSQANLGNYESGRRYSGYFDPDKCYKYSWASNEADRHFYPVRVASNFSCNRADEWSGNYMNWAATQTIDPFRQALTGGLRVRDEPGETWLEKARHARDGLFPTRRVPATGSAANTVGSATPANWSHINTRIQGLGNRMRFTRNGNLNSDSNVVAYDPEARQQNLNSSPDTVYEVSVRVRVCDPGVGLEANCRQYRNGWKPEGLIQEYSDRIRYSIFGFLNESGNQRNGGVMRARQKYVGPRTYYPEKGPQVNPNREWDANTGVLVRNPDPIDATATGHGVADSGVINYLNKFGQMTNALPKANDPVSELYYAALRYFRGQGNLAEYSNNLNAERTDGFPVITNWDEPLRYSCQINAALGIGDVNTHEDHNLPEPDLGLARQYTQKIYELEGINKAPSAVFSGRGNSAYIAGLAYYARTNDLRPDDPAKPQTAGRQTLATYWVDVREDQILQPKNSNQYWLAAKYGGFQVPANFNPLQTTGLDPAWWHTSREYLGSGKGGDVTMTNTGYPRADNFYVASEAERMVDSLRLAFRNIVEEMVGSGGGFASNSSSLEAGTRTFQSLFRVDGNAWSGDLQAYNVDPATGALSLDWTASSRMPAWDARRIFVNSDGFRAFEDYSDLSPAHRAELRSQEVVDYLRGDRSREKPAGGLRRRVAILGDIVNSEPVYVGAPNANLFRGATFEGADVYQAHAADSADRAPMVYVGANDGMLHAFNAETGAEAFAFVPSAAIDAGLGDYADPEFEHRYFVDGELTVADIFDTTALRWRTILVGTMGRGGRAVYALDVTDPSSVEFLWERNGDDVSALGNALGKPIIAQVGNGDWKVFLGNGPNSDAGESALISFDVLTGDATVHSTGITGDNGLSGVNVWASTPRGFSDTVYAGDLGGNLWKFNLGSGTATRLFQSGASQPITATPLVSRRPATNETWVFFGTGRYLNEADLGNKSLQTWYGVIDRDRLVSKSQLTESEILVEDEIDDVPVRAISEPNVLTGDGWFMDLRSPVNGEEGERMVVPNRFRGQVLIGTTRIPDGQDPCAPGGRGYIMAIDPFTGGRLPGNSFFDVDGDGSFIEVIGQPPMPVSGIGMPSGPNSPIFVGDILQVSLDDASNRSVRTRAGGMEPRRVSWRELLGD